MNYSTSFPNTENPLSEGGNWIDGASVGLDWGNVRSTPGQAFGAQTNVGSNNFADSTALLVGAWGPDQTVQGVVKTINQNTSIFEEIEIRLRSNLSAHSCTGYEVIFSCRPSSDSSRYIQIIKWNGALGDFTQIAGITGPGLNNGDTVKATIVGSTITAYINGASVLTVDNSVYTTGQPGIGFYMDGGTVGQQSDYGYTSLTVTDGLNTSTTVLKRLGRFLRLRGLAN